MYTLFVYIYIYIFGMYNELFDMCNESLVYWSPIIDDNQLIGIIKFHYLGMVPKQ